METKHGKIRSKAVELLEKNPNGIRYSELVRMISSEFPEIPVNTVHGALWDLGRKFPDRI